MRADNGVVVESDYATRLVRSAVDVEVGLTNWLSNSERESGVNAFGVRGGLGTQSVVRIVNVKLRPGWINANDLLQSFITKLLTS